MAHAQLMGWVRTAKRSLTGFTYTANGVCIAEKVNDKPVFVCVCGFSGKPGHLTKLGVLCD